QSAPAPIFSSTAPIGRPWLGEGPTSVAAPASIFQVRPAPKVEGDVSAGACLRPPLGSPPDTSLGRGRVDQGSIPGKGRRCKWVENLVSCLLFFFRKLPVFRRLAVARTQCQQEESWRLGEGVPPQESSVR